MAARADGEMMIVGREPRQHLVEHGLIVGDELALGPPLERAAERIERRAAQEFQFRQQPEAGSSHGPKLILRGRPVPCRARE